jgi:hypothetical protein
MKVSVRLDCLSVRKRSMVGGNFLVYHRMYVFRAARLSKMPIVAASELLLCGWATRSS